MISSSNNQNAPHEQRITSEETSEASLLFSSSNNHHVEQQISQEAAVRESEKITIRTQHTFSVFLFSFFLISIFVVCWSGYHLHLLKGMSWLNPQGSCLGETQQEPYLCLSPRRLIYGTLSNISVPSLVHLVVFPMFISPLVFPNLISLVIGVILLLLCCKNLSFFYLLKTLFVIQWSVFVIRCVLSFVLFRVFGWMESMLWAYDARHFIACNYGVTSFIMFAIVQSISRLSDDTVRNSSRNLVVRVVILLVACFAIHFTAHLPFNEIIPFRYDTDVSKQVSSFTSRYSDYMIDHTIGCILGFLFA